MKIVVQYPIDVEIHYKVQRTAPTASTKATEGTLAGLTHTFIDSVRDAFLGDRNHCIECGMYTVYSPYACEQHADKRGGDGGEDE